MCELRIYECLVLKKKNLSHTQRNLLKWFN